MVAAMTENATATETDESYVTHEPDESRFALYLGEIPIGEVDYEEADGKLTITHTGVREEYRAGGRAAKITDAALHYAVENHLAVVPQCPYTAWYLQKNDIPGLVVA